VPIVREGARGCLTGAHKLRSGGAAIKSAFPLKRPPRAASCKCTLGASAGAQVLLGTDGIGFVDPGTKVRINLGRRREAEMMYMVARGDRVDPAEPGMREPAGEYDVPVEPVLTRRDLGKGHANVKRDPGLFGKDGNGPAGGNRAPNALVEGANGGVLSLEVVLEVVPTAGVGLVAVREGTPATRTGPQGGTPGCAHIGAFVVAEAPNGLG
jgi:hypothetical protein